MLTHNSSFYCKIVGVTFGNRQVLINNLYVGQKLLLIRDPNNQYDSNAIKVCIDSTKVLGHIPKETAINLAKAMDIGIRYEAEVSNITGGGSLNYGVNILIKN